MKVEALRATSPYWIAIIAALTVASAAPAADDKALRTGRRNGTFHGPSTRGFFVAPFVAFQSFTSRCDEGFIDHRPCKHGAPAHVVAGAGLRNAGQGTVRLRGIPAGAHLEAAYLYIGLIEDPFGLGLPLEELTFAGHPIPSTLVAGNGRHCWESGPGALVPGVATLHRAEVTHLLDPSINGDYSVAGVPSGRFDLSDPFSCLTLPCTPILTLAQGVSLLVVFRHRRVPSGSAVYIHEPWHQVPFLVQSLTVEHQLVPPVNPDWKRLRFTSIGGDGQTRDPDPAFRPLAPIASHLLLGADGGWIRGPFSEIEPNSDWTGLDGGTVLQLWEGRTTLVYRGELGAASVAPIHDYFTHYEAIADPTRDYDCVNPLVHVLEVMPE